MKKLSRNEMKNVKGGKNAPASGCFCSTFPINVPSGYDQSTCQFNQNIAFCNASQVYVCCRPYGA